MTEKEIKDLLAVAKEVNKFRSYVSTLVCPVCGLSLKGNIDSISLTKFSPFCRISCPHCSFFKMEGPTISGAGDGRNGNPLTRIELLRKAIFGITSLVNRYHSITCLGPKHEKDFSDEDVRFIK